MSQVDEMKAEIDLRIRMLEETESPETLSEFELPIWEAYKQIILHELKSIRASIAFR